MNAMSNIIKLEDLCHFVNGGAWNESEYTDTGIPVLKVSNFNENSFSTENISFLSKEASEKYRKHKLKKNDLVIATVGSHQSLVNSAAGRTIAINSNISGFYLNQNAVFLRSKNINILDQIYLKYLGESQSFRHFIQVRGKGAANQMRIAIGDIKSYPVNLPPLPTQQKMAHILSAYDDLIENNLKRIKLLEEMAQITYEQWFVRMKFPNHENTAIDTETELPEGWSYSRLSDEIELIRDTVLPTKLGKTVLYIGLEHMPRKSITLSKYGSSKDISSLKTKVKTGDILFGKIRPYFHKVGIALNDCITSTDNIVVRPNKSNLRGIILQTMFSDAFVASATQSSNGTKMPRANWNILKNHKIIIPNTAILEKFSTISISIIASISNLSDQNQHLKEARDILLPRLMTGIIDVDKITLPKQSSHKEAKLNDL